jgi:hypothetical protein
MKLKAIALIMAILGFNYAVANDVYVEQVGNNYTRRYR